VLNQGSKHRFATQEFFFESSGVHG
jgi:hypothetical protein